MMSQEIRETDEEIIVLYKSGNPLALKKLIDKYTPPLYNFIARIAGQNNAPDIVQETFIKIWKNINRFDPAKASFKTWIFAVAKNTATDFLRKRRRILFSDLKNEEEDADSFALNVPDESLLPDVALQKLQDSELLNDTLNKLPLNYREVLVLHYQEEMTFGEIGKILNKPLNTVKSYHHRAILELQKMLM